MTAPATLPAIDVGPDLLARLRVAVDPEAMLAILRRHGGHLANGAGRLAACEVLRVFPRGAEGFVVAYRLEVERDRSQGSRAVPLFAELHPGEARARAAAVIEKLDKRRGQLGAMQGEAEAPILALPEPGLVLRPQGLDERLPGIALLQRPGELLDRLRALAPRVVEGRRAGGVEILGHRLGKRLTARLRLEGAGGPDEPRPSAVIVKLYSPRHGRGRRALAAMQGVRRAAPALRVPCPLAYLDDEAILVMEAAGGRELSSLAASEIPAALRRGGAALAALHALPLAVAPTRHGVAEELALLESWVALTAETFPRLRPRLGAAWATLWPALLAIDQGAPEAVLHRDFYDQQLLVGRPGAEVTIIDYDTLALGDPALDVGNFLAHLELRSLQGVGRPGMEQVFLDGYGAAAASSPTFARRVATWRAAARLRLACLHAFSSIWRGLASPLLDESAPRAA